LTKIVGGVSGGGALLFSLSLFNVKTDPKTTGSARLTAQDIETIASVTDILYKDYLIDRAYGMLNK
jgi:hypothetical protein